MLKVSESCPCGAATSFEVEVRPADSHRERDVMDSLLRSWRGGHKHLAKVGPCGEESPMPALGLIDDSWHPPCELAADHTGQHQHTMPDGGRITWPRLLTVDS